jgi:3-oxoadipate enol-lactonase
MTCELHHAISGAEDRAPLVLAGSLGTSLQMWDPQVAALSERLRLIAIDHRGHGRSPVPSGPYRLEDLSGDLLGLLDRLGLKRVSFCGLSLGGMVGLWLAANAPARIDRLVVICSAAHLPPADRWNKRAAVVRAAGSPKVIADAVVEAWFTRAWAAARPELVADYRRMVAGTPAEGYAACCEAIAGVDLRSNLANIKAPTLVIAGAHDLAAPPEHGREIADGIAGARLEILDAAHLASVERAEKVSQLIAAHVEGTAHVGLAS